MQSLVKLVVFVHLAICAANLASLVLLPFYTDPWIWIPLETFLGQMFFRGCPVTKLENYLREKAGMPQIKSFVGHYFKGEV
jgi:hypothetical protein